MSHFAEVDDNNIVLNVIVAEQEYVDSLDGRWIQTSYNTRGGIHYAPNSNDPDGGVALRKNYANKGYTYNESIDAFIPPQTYVGWILNESSYLWEPPIPVPDNEGLDKVYDWDENTQSWILLINGPEEETPIK